MGTFMLPHYPPSFSELPTLLEYFSYNLCFFTILAGPTCTYNEYVQMITGENFKVIFYRECCPQGN